MVRDNRRALRKRSEYSWPGQLEGATSGVAYVSKENFKAVLEVNPLSSIRENKLFFKTEKLDYDEVEDLIARILAPSRFV